MKEGSLVSLVYKGINFGLEALWLLTIMLVPLVFLHRDSFISEAAISFIEVPKVTVLRSLTNLMLILCILRWVIDGFYQHHTISDVILAFLKLSKQWDLLRKWVRSEPRKLLILSVCMLALSTILSTILSGEFTVSLWGEVPGQDGYSTYTVFSYFILFGVLISNVRSDAQVKRVLASIVAVGVFVSGYGILQHYHHDFLNLSADEGRITAFMGNAIFAASVLLVTLIISVACAVSSLSYFEAHIGHLKRLNWHRGLTKLILLLCSWGLILGVQITGLLFTYSRGPWIGAMAALLIFWLIVSYAVGWNKSLRGLLVLLLGISFAISLLVFKGSVTIPYLPSELGITIAVVGLAVAACVFVTWQNLWRLYIAMGLAALVVVTICLLLVFFASGDLGDDSQPERPLSVASEASSRLASITSNVTSGDFGGRATHWAISWELIKYRPWPEFDQLSLRWLRTFVGYGPDLYRYVYLLRSPPLTDDALPYEPDHAHNYFLHQTVELGLFGLISVLGVFTAFFWLGICILRDQISALSDSDKIITVGLISVGVGRFLEMMVGVARVSDLLLLWVVLAALISMSCITTYRHGKTDLKSPSKGEGTASNIKRSGRHRFFAHFTWLRFIKSAIAVWLILVLVGLIWVKNVNYVLAGVHSSNGVHQYYAGNLQASLDAIDHSVLLAPDIAIYHNYRGGIYAEFESQKEKSREVECDKFEESVYHACLTYEGYRSHEQAVNQRPLYYGNRMALASFFADRHDYEAAIDNYLYALQSIPHSWVIQNELAKSYIALEKPREAIKLLNRSISITSNTDMAVPSLLLISEAHRLNDDLESSAQVLERSWGLGLNESESDNAFANLEASYQVLGVNRGIEGYERMIAARNDSQKVEASLGRFLRASGENQRALELFNGILERTGPRGYYPILVNIAETYRGLGDVSLAASNYKEALYWLGRRGESAESLREMYPSVTDTWLKHVDLLIHLGRHAEAEIALSDADKWGSILIAEPLQNRLDVLKESGEYEITNVALNYMRDNKMELAAQSLENSMILDISSGAKEQGYKLLSGIYKRLGLQRAIEGYNRIYMKLPVEDQKDVATSFNKGRFLSEAGEYRQALPIFTNLLDLSPIEDHFSILIAKADTYMKMGMVSEADMSYRKALHLIGRGIEEADISPGDTGYGWLALAKVQVHLGHHRLARESLDKVEELELNGLGGDTREYLDLLDERDSYHVYLKAMEHRQSGESELAIKFLEDNLALELSDGARKQGFELLADLYKSVGVPEAIKGYERIEAKRQSKIGDDFSARMNMALFLADYGRADQAVGILDNLVKVSPENDHIVLLAGKANIYMNIGVMDKALEVYRDAFVTWGRSRFQANIEEATPGIVKLVTGGARIYQGKHKEARDSLSEAYDLGERAQSGMLTEYLNTLETREEYHLNSVALGYQRAGELELAAQSLEDDLGQEMSFSAEEVGYKLLSEIYQSLGKDRAVKGYDRIDLMIVQRLAIPQKIGNLLTRVNKGKYLSESGHYDEALNIFNKQLDLSPIEDHFSILIAKADTYMKMGNLTMAESFYFKAIGDSWGILKEAGRHLEYIPTYVRAKATLGKF